MLGRALGWSRRGWVLVAVVLGVLWLASSAAADSQCPAANPSAFGPCGPTFTLPEWGDAGGWTSPDQSGTIQFGRVLGNGREQLIGRAAAGIEVWDFDTTVGQWRPAVDSQNKPMILTGFADPPALTQANPTFGRTDWTDFSHYPTIQVADVLGNGRDQIIARANSGITVWSYTPGASGAAGTWSQVYSGEPFSDADGFVGLLGAAASQTIHTAELTGDGKADVFALTPSGVVQAYEWNRSGFTQLPAIRWNIPPSSAQAATLQASPMISGRQELWYADGFGMNGVRLNAAGNGWTSVKTPGFPTGGPCAVDETSPTPWGSSPAYYDTCRVVNVTGDSNAVQVVGRGTDGLDLWELTSQGTWQQLATLSAFSDAGGWNQGKYYPSIQYANLDGSASGQQEVIARGSGGVVVYKYDLAANQWDQLSNNQIRLTDDPWGTGSSYYSTLRLGDASGDGHQDTLIARGPYGIRTWFYGLGGQTGWSAYSPSGYPSFTGNQQNAYAALNQLPAIQGLLAGVSATTIRDYWTAENAPSSASLGSLQGIMATAAGCSGEQTFSPPQYQSCTPPSGSTGFTAQDWTAVVNELLSEAWDAQKVVAFYAELDTIRQQLFIAEGAELPAIAGKLNLSAATNTPTSFNVVGLSSAMLGIAASAAFEAPVVSAALWVTSEIVSMIPSASPDLTTNNFDGTYNQLQNIFASGISQTQKALASQSLQVRSDLNLSRLVTQLRQRGTWAMDDIGAESASNQGFALSIYKTLMPVMDTRYEITNCTGTDNGPVVYCSRPSAGVLGGRVNFTSIGPNPTAPTDANSTPCVDYTDENAEWCQFAENEISSTIADEVWGSIQSNCDYVPGNPNTVWTFGCSLGVNPATSILADWTSVKEYWAFPTCIGDPYVDGTTCAPVSGVAATAGTGAAGSLGRAATVRLRGTFRAMRPVDVSRVTVVLDRVLFDRLGVGELLHHVAAPAATRAASSQLPQPFAPTTLRHTGGGSFSGPLGAPPGQLPPRIQLKLTPSRGRSLAFELTISNVAIPVPPAACVPGNLGLTSSAVPFPLTLKLTLREPKRKPQAISVSPLFTCQRDRTGAIRALTVVEPRHPKLGPGLSVQIRHPDRLTVGHPGTLTMSVHNRTHSTAYDVFVRVFLPLGLRVVSHSPGVIVRHRLILRRVAKLQRGKSQTIRLGLVPTRSVRRCTIVTADAILRKQTARSACIKVLSARAPASGTPTGGLG